MNTSSKFSPAQHVSPGPEDRHLAKMAEKDDIKDVEKANLYKESSASDSPDGRASPTVEQGEVEKSDGFFSAFTANSFKRNPNARVVQEATDAEGRPLKDQPPAEPALAMKLKQRHLQMIAIGGSIGMSCLQRRQHEGLKLTVSKAPACSSALAQLCRMAVLRLSSSLTV